MSKYRMKYPKQEVRDAQTSTLIRVIDGGFCRNYRTAVDGGANIGDWSAIMSRSFERVHAFEPVPGTAADLSMRLREDGIENVTVHAKALLNRQTSVEMYLPQKRTKATSYSAKPDAGDVPAIPLDALGLTDVDLLKLDLEGAEYLALQGATKTIRASWPVLIIEIDRMHQKRFGQTVENVIDLIVKGFGYRQAFVSNIDYVFIPHPESSA